MMNKTVTTDVIEVSCNAIDSIGVEASRILLRCATGRVIASFHRCFYVQNEYGIVCVGSASLGRGPLHIVVKSRRPDGHKDVTGEAQRGSTITFPGADLIKGGAVYDAQVMAPTESQLVSKGDCSDVAQHAIAIMSCCAPSTDVRHGFGWLLDETVWSPDNGLCDVMPGGLAEGLTEGRAGGLAERLVQSLEEEPRDAGGRVSRCSNSVAEPTLNVMTAIDQGLRKQCQPALQFLYSWLKESVEKSTEESLKACHADAYDAPHAKPLGQPFHSRPPGIPQSISTLLGAGPGLTPAGDDLLAGVMLALHRIGRSDLVGLLWDSLQLSLLERTNAISGAHLRMAAQGYCCESALQLLDRLMDMQAHRQQHSVQSAAVEVARIADTIGSSSGWDTLAGIALVVRALACSTEVNRTRNERYSASSYSDHPRAQCL